MTKNLAALLLLTLSAPMAASSEPRFAPKSTTNYAKIFRQQEQSLQDNAPIPVFVLVGQSNMVGHGILSEIDESTGQEKNATLKWLATNVPDQFGMLLEDDGDLYHSVAINHDDGASVRWERIGKPIRSKQKQPMQNAKWKTRQDVLVACNSRSVDDLSPHTTDHGKLQAGFCAGDPGQEGQQVGPELGFGWAIGDALSTNESGNQSKALLLKIACGGKSLAVDFRPPSSGGEVGTFYTSMIAMINNTLADIGNIYPNEVGRSFQLAGFAWHQGRNDGCDDKMAKEYETNLANLIRDVRKDLYAPNLPFAVAATGMVGFTEQSERRKEVIEAELDVSKYPEFEGNVVSVDTRPFARDPSPASPTDFIYHWNSNAESYWLIGQNLGRSIMNIILERQRAEDQTVVVV
mmetsp:Transcript_2674/g.5729  ORF Transcript_2674/g.5729 Transcript_2674/m.5729 type:complete len:406 (+) Transcript_2674:192-1409(+)|eukprot:CAMPEP_0171363248 /NCGR_PEP_ID=MMETSP0879-20121228/3234_1 /TAXON_ID=67004 /ORGANISM="Thalassiosira weissflogii, Strain CCMP1336" /LENGTH=405 /DNA_ID=CAMNT_0011870363 /DNA_START=100 /DNA_END=1317 /DNA_ORIENTATION=+